METSTYAGSDLFELTDLGIWSAGALHIALQIQKSGQGKNKNKGSTFMVFDKQEIYKNELADLLLDPPECTDAYYERAAKALPFDQVIDTPFFVQSERVPAIQLADVFAFIIRRHIEIADGYLGERFDGEGALLQTWFDHSKRGSSQPQLAPPSVPSQTWQMPTAHRCRRRSPADSSAPTDFSPVAHCWQSV